jgi:hypothetical protein
LAQERQSDLFKTSEKSYTGNYTEHLLEQYRLYVEMSDRLSARRALTNTFFLTANTALLSAIAILSRYYFQQTRLGAIIVLFVVAGPIAFCWAWHSILTSYQKLSTAKFEVIHELETKLPANLYDHEWTKLGRGKDPKKYTPLTNIERIVPTVFVMMYLILAAVDFLVALGFIHP